MGEARLRYAAEARHYHFRAWLVDPEKITVPILIMRGQYDGIAALEDLLESFRRL